MGGNLTECALIVVYGPKDKAGIEAIWLDTSNLAPIIWLNRMRVVDLDLIGKKTVVVSTKLEWRLGCCKCYHNNTMTMSSVYIQQHSLGQTPRRIFRENTT